VLEHGTVVGAPLTGDPLLAPLKGNGGPTMTMALGPGSAAIDAGFGCGPIDQRGLPRPDAGEAACDIGAYETQDPILSGPLRAFGPVPPVAPVPPVVSSLKLTPSSFRAAPRGPSAAARKRYGGKVSFVLNEPASVTFTVASVQPGRKRARGLCVAPTRANRRLRRCSRLVRVPGSFSRSGASGTSAFRFSGRLGGQRLRAGKYMLIATASASGLTGRAVSAPFQIIR
jgi:hypothetical protein